jgi:regulator of replication initiation timing
MSEERTGLGHDRIAQIVGSLYLDSYTQIESLQNKLQQYSDHIDKLQLENNKLRAENEARVSKDNVGQNPMSDRVENLSNTNT